MNTPRLFFTVYVDNPDDYRRAISGLRRTREQGCPSLDWDLDYETEQVAVGAEVSDADLIGAPSTDSMPEVSAYEVRMAERLGVSVEQLRREQADADHKGGVL